MEVQLKELLEKINKDGVESAEAKASEIVSDAEKKADQIIADARKKAEKIVSDAKNDAVKAEAGGKAAIKQAGRDLILKTKTELESLFKALIDADTKSVMNGKVLEEAVVTVVKSWASGKEYDIQLSKKDFSELENGLKSRLSDELKKGVEIKPFPGVDYGFRVAEKDGGAYFNFTAEAVAANLAELLNPRLSEIVKDSTEE